MGRKPDLLVASYFDRGNKLPDASNRYSFTCRGCQTVFPKGRTSHLLNHLMGGSRCPALTQEDVRHILTVQASRSAEKAQRTPTKRTATYSFIDQEIDNNNRPASKRQALAINGSPNNLSGLEALAEASRRVERPTSSHNNSASIFGDDVIIDPLLGTSSIFSDVQQSSPIDLSSITVSASNTGDSRPPSQGRPSINENSEIIYAHGTRSAPHDTGSGALIHELNEAANFPVLIAAHPNAQSALPSEDTSAGKGSKTRSKFSEVRREEVRNVRSKRACIRCRMLRKPCSPNDPCIRCTSVKNPRIWSSRCTRGRLTDVCDLWSSTFSVQAVQARIDSVKATKRCSETQLNLHACLASDVSIMLDYPVTMFQVASTTAAGEKAIVPAELTHQAAESIRVLLSQLGKTSFPAEVRSAMEFGAQLTTDHEIRLYHKAESLYRCTRFLAAASDEITLALQWSSDDEDNMEFDSSDVNKHDLHTAFTSIIEQVAQEDCHSLLKDLEQALVNRTVPASTVLVASLMLFFSLELLGYRFHTRRDLEEDVESASFMGNDSQISAAAWIEKLEKFASFMQDLLRCRHIIDELHVDGAGVINVLDSSTDTATKNLFASMAISPALLTRVQTNYVAGDPSSLYFKHVARVLLFAQPKGQLNS